MNYWFLSWNISWRHWGVHYLYMYNRSAVLSASRALKYIYIKTSRLHQTTTSWSTLTWQEICSLRICSRAIVQKCQRLCQNGRPAVWMYIILCEQYAKHFATTFVFHSHTDLDDVREMFLNKHWSYFSTIDILL